MSTRDDPSHLLEELETLQKVLDGADADLDLYSKAPTFAPMDEIPILDELFEPEPMRPVLTSIKPSQPATLKAVPDHTPRAESPKAAEPLIEAPSQPLAAAATTERPETVALVDEKLARAASNPFLPKSILDRLAHERQAAQHSAAEAHATMVKASARHHEMRQSGAAGMNTPNTPLNKQAIIDELVAEMLPDIERKLRIKLQLLLQSD